MRYSIRCALRVNAAVSITFRDARLRGWKMLHGLLIFYLACSFGALTNITAAQFAFGHACPWVWVLAAVTGVIVSSVWNSAVSSIFAWQRNSG